MDLYSQIITNAIPIILSIWTIVIIYRTYVYSEKILKQQQEMKDEIKRLKQKLEEQSFSKRI